jgi:hypothetical protein
LNAPTKTTLACAPAVLPSGGGLRRIIGERAADRCSDAIGEDDPSEADAHPLTG